MSVPANGYYLAPIGVKGPDVYVCGKQLKYDEFPS